MEIIVYIFAFVFHILDFSHTYNIDINSPYFKSVLFNESRFGFAVNIFTKKQSNEKYILVGAPFADLKIPHIHNSGALYSCPVNKEYMDCLQLNFEEYSNGSLLGFVVDSNIIDGAVYTCAPRFLREYANVRYVEGACFELNNDLKHVESISNEECVSSIKRNTQNYEYRNCLTGGALKSLSNKQLLLTAPYAYEGKGLLIDNIFYSHINARSSKYLGFENSNSKYQLAGFSVSIGNIYREVNVKTILLGAPGIMQFNSATQLTYGSVKLVKFISNSLSNDSSEIAGDQFGSGFGYSVLAIDLDGDGFDEVVVGAPYTDYNIGQVLIYWNNVGAIPVDVNSKLVLASSKEGSRGQFGIAVENIGDINRDSIPDLAVGAPFNNDGLGSVYIYQGKKDRLLTLSQQIDGRMIAPDLRGFGFSIFGRNEDLDSNGYPDLIVGAVISGHVVGLRSRPIMRIYADNIVSNADMVLPYDFDGLPKCTYEGVEIPCIDLSISIYYYYPHLDNCLNDGPTQIEYQLELDSLYLQAQQIKRVHFAGRSSVLRDKLTIKCKIPTAPPNSPLKTLKLFIPPNIFFNISVPIEVRLKWSVNLPPAPKRNLKGEPLVDLSGYPILDNVKNELTNQIRFGAGCTAQTCKPILTMQPNLALPRDGDDYLLYIGNVTKFNLSIPVKNIATDERDQAYRTYLKISVDPQHLLVSSTNPERSVQTSAGLIYSIQSPLLPGQSVVTNFKFSLTNNFIQNTSPVIFINISMEAMSPQPYLVPIIIKIRIKMVADIDLKVAVVPNNYRFYENVILGFKGITSEENIGPRLKLTISLQSKIPNSFILSSKLLVLFPFEIAGNPLEVDGQFMLYLLRYPKFSVSARNKNISCDSLSLQRATNIIKTRLHETYTSPHLKDVLLKNVSLPDKMPKLPDLQKNLVFYSDESDPKTNRDWEGTVVVDCLKGSARCIPIICDLGPLSRQVGELTFEFDVRIWLHTLIENFLKYKFVFIEIPVYWIPLVNYDIVMINKDGYFKSVRVVASNTQKPQPPPSLNVLYAVLIAVLVGVILLATIVIICYKCEFFRRQNIPNRKRK